MKQLWILGVLLVFFAVPCLADAIRVNDLRMKVDYDEAYTYSIEKKDKIDTLSGITNSTKINLQVLPGSNVTFTFKIENTLSDINIHGTIVKLTVEEIDDGGDFDIDSDEVDLDAGNEETVDLVVPIPIDVESKSYFFDAQIEGHDTNGTVYTQEIRNKFDVNRLAQDIRITKAQLAPSLVSCDRKTVATVEIMNAGSQDQNDAALEIQNANFGINFMEKDIILKASDQSADESSYTKKLNIEIPSFMRAGIYTINANLYWKNYVLFDRKQMQLIVKDCGTSKTNQSKPTATQNNQPKNNQTSNVIASNSKVSPQNNVFDSGNLYTTIERSPIGPILVFGIGFMAVVLIVILAVLARVIYQNRHSKL